LTAECINVIDCLSYTADSILISQDATIIYTCSSDKTIRMLDRFTGNCIKEFKGHTDFIKSFVISADEQKIFSWSEDGTIRIWQTSENTKEFAFDGVYFGSANNLASSSQIQKI